MSSACRRFMCDVCYCQTHHCAINIYQTNRLFRRFSSAPLEFVTTVSLITVYYLIFSTCNIFKQLQTFFSESCVYEGM